MKKYDIVKMVQSLATVISAGALLSKDNPGSAKQASTDLENSSWEFWLQTSATAIQVLSFAYYRWKNSKPAASLALDHTDGSGDDNADYMIPVFEEYKYDKDNPGVYITIL